MILIIAYGNDLREDDGAGPLLAARLASVWQSHGQAARLIAVQQPVPELAADIVCDGVTAVVFVDTRVSTSQADRDVAVVPVEPVSEVSPSLGHHVQPETLLTYARVLSATGSVPPAWLVTVPGVAFEYGERLSDVAQAALRKAFEDSSSPLNGLMIELSAHG
jgi:hydrogenase maturation protease